MTTPSRTTNTTTAAQDGRHTPDIAFDERRTAVRRAMREFDACLGDHAWEGCHDLCCEDPPTDAVIRCYTLAGEEDLPLGTMTRWALYDMHTDLESAVRGTDRFRLEFRLEPDQPPYGRAEWNGTQRSLVLRCDAASHVEPGADRRDAVLGAVMYFGSCAVEIFRDEPGLRHYYDRLVSDLTAHRTGYRRVHGGSCERPRSREFVPLTSERGTSAIHTGQLHAHAAG
jgi:hypothetical protein